MRIFENKIIIKTYFFKLQVSVEQIYSKWQKLIQTSKNNLESRIRKKFIRYNLILTNKNNKSKNNEFNKIPTKFKVIKVKGN